MRQLAENWRRIFLSSIVALLCIIVGPSTAGVWSLEVGDVFDVREATIDSIHDALFNHRTTCREIVSSFIARIEEFNPIINAVVSLNPAALSVADGLDARLASGNATGALFCIPVLLKDNFDAVGMPTTGGCRALAANKPQADAPTVRALADAGAVILGKTNLHEMALEGLTVSSLGGQTVNPYDLTRTPGGSSGGSGAAVAASLAVLATGTDTVNSLRSPASANALFSFRPTRGLISRAGVIPVSFTQDAVGAMARSPRDLAVALAVMAGVGYDPRDNATALAPPEVRRRRPKDYLAALSGVRLEGLRFGLLDGFFNRSASPETTPVNAVMDDMVARLEAAGAKVVNITDPIFDTLAIAPLDVQAFEFREQLDAYLAGASSHAHAHVRPRPRPRPHPTSFHDLYRQNSFFNDRTNNNNNDTFLVIPSQHAFLRRAARASTGDAAYAATLRRIGTLARALEATFAAHRLDALLYPEQRNLAVRLGAPSQAGRNGILAALTGYPVVCVPAGFAPGRDSDSDSDSGTAPAGLPVGMEVLGRPWSEDLLLGIAARVAGLVGAAGGGRVMPPFANGTVEPRSYGRVPVIAPGSVPVPAEYPVGVF